MVVQLCSWIFELCSCIWKICVQWQLKVEDWDLALKNCSNYPPPRIHRTLRQPPSWKSAWEITPTTLPLEFTERYDNPPLGNRPEKSLQLPPPRIHRTLRQPPSWKSAWEITPTTPPVEFTPNVELVQLEKILRITPAIRVDAPQSNQINLYAIKAKNSHYLVHNIIYSRN